MKYAVLLYTINKISFIIKIEVISKELINFYFENKYEHGDLKNF
jgi:hypothetical protein